MGIIFPQLVDSGCTSYFLFLSFHSTASPTASSVCVAHSSLFLSMCFFPPSCQLPLVCCRSTCGEPRSPKVKHPSPVRLESPQEPPKFIQRLQGARDRMNPGMPSSMLRLVCFVAKATEATWLRLLRHKPMLPLMLCMTRLKRDQKPTMHCRSRSRRL